MTHRLLSCCERRGDEAPRLIEDHRAGQDHTTEQGNAHCQRKCLGGSEECQLPVLDGELIRPGEDLDDLLMERERDERADPDGDHGFDQSRAKLTEMLHEGHGLVGHADGSSSSSGLRSSVTGSVTSSPVWCPSSWSAGIGPISVIEAGSTISVPGDRRRRKGRPHRSPSSKRSRSGRHREHHRRVLSDPERAGPGRRTLVPGSGSPNGWRLASWRRAHRLAGPTPGGASARTRSR